MLDIAYASAGMVLKSLSLATEQYRGYYLKGNFKQHPHTNRNRRNKTVPCWQMGDTSEAAAAGDTIRSSVPPRRPGGAPTPPVN